MTLGERIKKVRRANDFTQQMFATKIGTTANVLTNYETGRRNPSSSVINNICKTFNINEEWLRNGTGEMYMPKVTAALELLAMEHNLTNGDYRLIEKFLNLKMEARRALIDYVREVAAAIANDEDNDISSTSLVAISADSAGIPITSDEIRERANMYKYMAMDSADRELRRAGVDPRIEAEVAAYRQRRTEEIQRQLLNATGKIPEQPKIPTPVSEDGPKNADEESLMKNVQSMSPGQQELLFNQYNQARLLREQQKGASAASVPPAADDKAPESKIPDPS